LGELRNVEITRLSENGTTLTFGHKYDTLDTLNGVYDYNTKTWYKYAAVQSTGKPVEYVGKFVVSIYNIESKRAEEQGKDSTGSNTSEDIYKMSVVGVAVDGKYPIRYAEVTPDLYYVYNVSYADTRYNVEFTPRNMANRKMGTINSNCYPSTANITFLKSDRFGEAYSEFSDDATSSFFPIVYENNWITPSSSPLLWLPFSVKAEAIMPLDIDALMSANPYGVFTATINGVPVRIFIDEISNAPISRAQFSIEGRFSPSTDITKLI